MTIMYNHVSHISYTDLSPIPVRSAVKSYLTSWFSQNLSKRALNRLYSINIDNVIGLTIPNVNN